MANEYRNSSDALLDRILDITDEMYREMSSKSSDGAYNHFGLFGLFAELGKTLVNADRASFWKWDKRSHKLITKAAVGLDQIIIDEGTGMVGKALMEERAIVTNDPYNHPDFNPNVDKKTGYVTKSILVMPVSDCRGEIIGAYQAINKLDEERGFVLEEDCKRLSLAALICGISLESDIFLDDSQHDKLTEVKNRMGFQTDYDTKYLKVLKDEKSPAKVSIIMGDIDFFKKVNDTYGHNAGDAVLKHVANILEANVRDGDGVYRWGGEEFIAVLPFADVGQAAMVADRIRKKVMESVCVFEGTDIHVTMSFGCSEVSLERTLEENVKIADERLYRAKKGGRNQVIFE